MITRAVPPGKAARRFKLADLLRHFRIRRRAVIPQASKIGFEGKDDVFPGGKNGCPALAQLRIRGYIGERATTEQDDRSNETAPAEQVLFHLIHLQARATGKTFRNMKNPASLRKRSHRGTGWRIFVGFQLNRSFRIYRRNIDENYSGFRREEKRQERCFEWTG